MLKEKIVQADEYQSAYSLFFFLSSCSLAMAIPAGFIMLMLSWLLFGLFYAVAVSLDDTCVELSRYYHGTSAKITDMIMCPDPLEFLANYGTAFGMLNADLYNGYSTWHRHFGDNMKINPRTNSTCTNATTGSGYPLTSAC